MTIYIYDTGATIELEDSWALRLIEQGVACAVSGDDPLPPAPTPAPVTPEEFTERLDALEELVNTSGADVVLSGGKLRLARDNTLLGAGVEVDTVLAPVKDELVQAGKQQAANFGRALNSIALKVKYQIGRYTGSGFGDSQNYIRNRDPFPAGEYVIRAYTLKSRAFTYVSDTAGTSITSNYVKTEYTLLATGPWYINFQSDADLSASDIASVENSFAIEQICVGTTEEDAGFLQAELDGYTDRETAPICGILAPDLSVTTAQYRNVCKIGNRVYLRAVNGSVGVSQMMSITGDQVRPKEMTPSGVQQTTAYTADLGNLVPIADFRPIQIAVYNKNRTSTTHASRVQIRFYSVDENDAITYISTTSMELDDALGKILVSDDTVPEGATHFEIVVYTRGTTPINTDSYMVIRFDYAQPKIPSAPTTDGTYSLKCTVQNGAPQYEWYDAAAASE